MALRTHTGGDVLAGGAERLRYGGPRRRQAARRYEATEQPWRASSSGSHMPLDTEIHWSWRNPLNIIPAIMALLIVIAVLGVLI